MYGIKCLQDVYIAFTLRRELQCCRESDEEEVFESDAGKELADEIKASDDGDVMDVEAPSQKRQAPQTTLKVTCSSCQSAKGIDVLQPHILAPLEGSQSRPLPFTVTRLHLVPLRDIKALKESMLNTSAGPVEA